MNRIREIRKKRGLTQKVVSEQLNIPVTTFSQYERGDREPRVATWIKLSELFNTSIDYLVGNAPTIKMTRQQATIFAEYWDKDTPIDTKTFDYPESEIMKDFKNRQLAQAWLYPETIRVVDK